MNTPDTEWEKMVETMIVESDICTHKGLHSNGMCTGKIHLASGTYLELKKTLAIGIEKLCTSRDTYWKERVRKEVEELQERFGDWDNGDENEPLLLKCEVLGILDNLK